MFDDTTTTNAALDRLLTILSRPRPHGSEAEKAFVEAMLKPYEPFVLTSPADGEALAYVIDVGGPNDTRTMFSCHIDTVGRAETQRSLVYVKPDVIGVTKDTDCLGADDGAGIWLMLEMIDAGVPGCYVFHRGEERGGIGSRGVAAHHPGFLAGFERAIAFDRRGTHSVITHQGFSRCCSDEFAEALAAQLTAHIGGEWFFAPDDTGIFTDTANYTDDIGECTNISCGYANEHSSAETLDVNFLFALRDACLKVDWEALPSKRRPGEVDPDDFAYNPLPRWGGTLAYYEPLNGFDYKRHTVSPLSAADAANLDYYDLVDWVTAYPEKAAELLFNLLHRGDEI